LDALQSGLFYLFATVALAGALLSALTRSRELAAGGLLLLAAGTGLVLADLSAGFAGLLVFILLAGSAALALAVPPGPEPPAGRAENLGALLAAVLFAALAYASSRGLFHPADYPGGAFNAAALGRLLLGRDALGVIAVAACALIGLAHLPNRLRAVRRR
jgi:hypothetical protein